YSICPNECEQSIYDSKINIAKYPSVWYAGIVSTNNFTKSYLKGKTLDDLERTTLMVNIYYDEMYYTVIDDSEAMNFEALFGNIGGNLGLFIGISVLTFVEIIETIFYIGYIFVLRYTQNNEKQE
ncbi:unnamed protein product, partial [Brachionus calyciflorus]